MSRKGEEDVYIIHGEVLIELLLRVQRVFKQKGRAVFQTQFAKGDAVHVSQMRFQLQQVAERVAALAAFWAHNVAHLLHALQDGVVVGGDVLTPSLASGCLQGVTRDLVLEWGAEVASVTEAELPFDVLFSADEVFITSSTRDVHPVTRIDEREMHAGPITQALSEVFVRRSTQDVDP